MQYHRWERRLRIAAGMLFCGWSFLLLNACRHEVLLPPTKALSDPAIESARERLRESGKRWKDWRKYKTERETPLILMDVLAESIPAPIEVSRLRLQREAGDGDGDFNLEMEGIFHGDEPSQVFRKWMDYLKSESAVTQVDNLKFRREDEGIAFSFAGMALSPEDSR